jgi:UDP-3-O-[3-hydroxymyristoyl] glucosamine N-acyltransferase
MTPDEMFEHLDNDNPSGFPTRPPKGCSIHPTAVVSPTACIGDNVTIGPFCEIGPKAVIADGCQLVQCTVEGVLGRNVRVWRYAHVMEDVIIGDDTQICNGAIVLTSAIVGARCNIQLWAGIARKTVIGNDTYIGPNVVFCNAKNPATDTHADLHPIKIGEGVAIGANCSIIGPLEVGDGAAIGAGATVTKSVPAGETWVGPTAKNIRVRR